MIHTREQLINEVKKIIEKYSKYGDYQCATKVVDLIATLNDKDETTWKNIP